MLHLREAAVGNAVIVEGRHDLQALDDLGIGGHHLVIHRGRALEVRIDELVWQAREHGWTMILLTDWDRTGGRLAERIEQGLAGRVPLDTECRRRVASASHTRCFQDVPADLAALRRRFAQGPWDVRP